MKEIRRQDRTISKEESIAILNKAEYGVLSTATEDGKPYGVPLNFCFINSCIYFHSAIEGHKVENMRHNKYVSFCVIGNTEILPAKFGTKYESVIVFGEAEEVFDQEKQIALEELIRKYSPEFTDKGSKYITSHKDNTKVFKINIHRITGKARK